METDREWEKEMDQVPDGCSSWESTLGPMLGAGTQVLESELLP